MINYTKEAYYDVLYRKRKSCWTADTQASFGGSTTRNSGRGLWSIYNVSLGKIQLLYLESSFRVDILISHRHAWLAYEIPLTSIFSFWRIRIHFSKQAVWFFGKNLISDHALSTKTPSPSFHSQPKIKKTFDSVVVINIKMVTF